MNISTSIHGIKTVEITEPRDCLDSQTRRITITTKSGERMEIVLFGDNAHNIEIKRESI